MEGTTVSVKSDFARSRTHAVKIAETKSGHISTLQQGMMCKQLQKLCHINKLPAATKMQGTSLQGNTISIAKLKLNGVGGEQSTRKG